MGAAGGGEDKRDQKTFVLKKLPRTFLQVARTVVEDLPKRASLLIPPSHVTSGAQGGATKNTLCRRG